MIVDTAPPLYSGAGAQAALLADRMRALGHRVDIIARQKDRVPTPVAGTVFVKPFVANGLLSSLLFRLAVGWHVLTTRADVVHCHGGYAYALFAVIASKLRSKPSIVKVTLIGSDDPATIAAKRAGPIRYGRFEARLFTWASCVIALNDDIRDIVLAASPRARVVVIPNGVDLSVARASVPDPDAPRVAYLGGLLRRKGTDTLLAAWPEFRSRHPNATLVLVGPQGAEMEDAFRNPDELASIGIRCTGMLSTNQAREVLATASLYVLPSRQEGQPNSLIEAMAAGLACCASDIPSNQLTAGDAAVYFPVGDPAGLSAALDHAWERRGELAAAGRRRAANFDIDAVVGRYLDLYRKLEPGSHG